MPSSFHVKDGFFYGWVITIAALAISAISFGVRLSFGVFFKSIEGDFGLSRGATSSVFSVYMLLCCVVSIFGGWALDRYGPRLVTFIMGSCTGLSLLLTSQTSSTWQLFLSYGVLLSLGTGAIYAVANSTVSRWFERKRGFALGISGAGGPLGTVFMAPFATYLISDFGWRTAMIVIGLVGWIVVASVSFLLRKDPGDMGLLPDGAKPDAAKTGQPGKANGTQLASVSLSQAFGTGSFWFMGLAWLLLSSNVHLIATHIVPHAIDMGISPMDAAVILSLIGGASVVGFLVVGRISDAAGRRLLGITCALLQLVALIWLLWAHNLWMLYLFAVAFGFSQGGFSIIITALIGDVFGMRSIGTIMGVLTAGWALGAAIGPAMGGVIFDVSGSYASAFATGAAAMLVASLLVALVRRQAFQT